MDKEKFRDLIVAKREADHQLLLSAAKRSHEAATHEDNVPDSKYETLALEASYIAQGQANRAQQIKQALEAYRKMVLQNFADDSSIRLSALVQLEEGSGRTRWVFLGPAAGGLMFHFEGIEIMLITPDSPLGQELMGSQLDDCISIGSGDVREYDIVAIK